MSVDYSQGTPPQPPQQKKGLGVVGWIAIGCGAILLLCLVALFGLGYMGKRFYDKAAKNPAKMAAELMVRADPNLEIVSSDDDSGTVTIRNKETNEEVTVNLDELKEGRIKFGTDEGESTVDFSGQGSEGGVNVTATDEKGQTSTFSAGAGGEAKLPDWLPLYPGSSAQGAYDATTPEGRSAMAVVTTSDSPEKVLAFYEERLKAEGIEVQKTTFENAGQTGGTVGGSTADQKRSVSIMVGTSEGKTQATVTFAEKP